MYDLCDFHLDTTAALSYFLVIKHTARHAFEIIWSKVVTQQALTLSDEL